MVKGSHAKLKKMHHVCPLNPPLNFHFLVAHAAGEPRESLQHSRARELGGGDVDKVRFSATESKRFPIQRTQRLTLSISQACSAKC